MRTIRTEMHLRGPALCVLGCLLMVFAGCGESVQKPDEEDSIQQTYQSDLQRNLSPDTGDLDPLVQDNWQLALDLYAALKDGENNLLLSPLSIHTAFGMVYAGARENTEAEMAQVLHYTLEQDPLHNAFNALDLALQERNAPGTDEEDPVELHVANAFWGRQGYPFRDDYLDILAVNYGAGIEAMNFCQDSEGARQIINGWVEDRTRDRIKDLLPEHSIGCSTVAVLVNALYFKAPWAKPFLEDVTADSTFHLLDGGVETVPMMTQEETFRYTEGDGYQAVEMTYRLDELSMVFILPADGRFAEFEASLDVARLNEIFDGLELQPVEITFPKFEFESTFKLKDTLRDLGMVEPFLPSADFSGIVDGGGIWIDEAYHKTYIGVDEKGTEAAAATAIVMVDSAAPEPQYFFTADRPFLFVIRDQGLAETGTGAILFIGRVLNPNG